MYEVEKGIPIVMPVKREGHKGGRPAGGFLTTLRGMAIGDSFRLNTGEPMQPGSKTLATVGAVASWACMAGKPEGKNFAVRTILATDTDTDVEHVRIWRTK